MSRILRCSSNVDIYFGDFNDWAVVAIYSANAAQRPVDMIGGTGKHAIPDDINRFYFTEPIHINAQDFCICIERGNPGDENPIVGFSGETTGFSQYQGINGWTLLEGEYAVAVGFCGLAFESDTRAGIKASL